MRKIILLFSTAIFGFIIFTGQKSDDKPQKWAIDQKAMWLYDASNTYSAPLPMGKVDYVHPVTETRIINTQNGRYAVSPNLRVLPRVNSSQTEVVIVRSPANPLVMFGSSNAISNTGSLFISEGVYVTTDGGNSWFGSDTLQGTPVGNHGGDPGPTIDKDGRIHMTHLGYTTSGMFANYSTNNGITWSANFTIESGSVDKNLAGTDDNPSSPFYGRSYCVYTTFSSPYPARCSYTSNGGVSWSSPITMVTPQSGYIARGEDVATGPNGEVYACWSNTVGSNPEDFLSFAKSTDGGVSFTGANNVVDMNGLLVFGTGFAPYGIRMNSFPRMAVDKTGGPRNGWIYICSSQKNLTPAGTDADIVMWKSTNGGANWSPAVRVNQDPLNNGKLQFYNAICVDQTGGINIVYYDNRNTAADSCEVMMSRSVDGGSTWTDIVVSDHRFKPKSVTISGVAAGYAGDYIGVTSQGTKIWPLWMDDVTGMYNAWTAGVQIATYPLSPFNLQTPAAGSRIVTFPGSTTPVTITWDTSATGAAYKWIFGNPTTATRRLTLNATTNSITTTLGALDDILAAAGFTNTGAATDSAVGQWDVWSFKVPGASGADSLKATNGPRALTLRRGQVNVTPFALVQPANNTTQITAPNDNSNITISWRSGGPGLKYKWQFKSGAFASPVTFNIPSNNSSFDTTLTIVNSTLDGMLNALGVQRGDSMVGQWRVYAYRSPTDSTASSETRNLTLRRVGSLPLNENFSGTTFPPAEWALTFTGTQYWTRQTASGYGVGSGSARYNMWSASAGTVQSLTSNVFPAVTAGANYLRFNYSHGYYLASGVLAADSIGIFTSTNGGTTWTSLITLKATQTPQVGVNSTSNLSTAASQTQFTPTATQWGTKIFAMPVGTNQVRFTGYSVFGNDAFIDDITAGGPTGVTNPIGWIPEKFELSQNYPNPFNPATKINFAVPKQSFVSIKVFDVTGREVAALVNDMKTAGYHSVEFNASAFASGVYFYKIQAADFVDTKRMVLVK
ncbi:MAG: T9SS type A sorting domain-containing protein [Bacteroidetes bacterium]|nr:T9SS type A sorting domain-containing protein [Bacteroidota bacterium]